MSTTSAESDLPLADEAAVRGRSGELQTLAESYGVTDLRYASPGRLVGHVAADRDLLDMIEFDLAASDMLAAKVSLFSDAVLDHPHVSADLVDARPL
ncbi:MAG TPA: hypothetical protein VMH41_05845 [Mycobacteriales bacterium]|nr:hypothetical protein [Mycobacteriales bacterium]